jgi:hypothetical protein
MNDNFRHLQRLAVEYDGHLRAGTEDSDDAAGCELEIADCFFRATDEECEAFGNFMSYLERRRNSMSTVTETAVYESRWGFHPVSYETFRKLKFLHKWYYQTLKDHARWRRWNRKFPHNRKGPEPQYCPFFCKENKFWRPEDHGVREAYQQARMPVPREEVQPLVLSVEVIDRMYEEVKTWVDKQEKSR